MCSSSSILPMLRALVIPILAVCTVSLAQQPSASPIQFELRKLPFHLTAMKPRQEMRPKPWPAALLFSIINGDGRPDIFFTNGADIATLKKTSPKYFNRLFRNDGNGKFTDVTAQAGLTGTGFDIGAAVGDYDNDGHPDIFVPASTATRSTTTTATAPSPMSQKRPASTSGSIRNTAHSGPKLPSGLTSTTTACSISSSSTICSGAIPTNPSALPRASPIIAIHASTKDCPTSSFSIRGTEPSRTSQKSGEFAITSARAWAWAWPTMTSTASQISSSPTTRTTISSFTTSETSSMRSLFRPMSLSLRMRLHLRHGPRFSRLQ